jgi:hypothetical protein
MNILGYVWYIHRAKTRSIFWVNYSIAPNLRQKIFNHPLTPARKFSGRVMLISGTAHAGYDKKL